MWPGAITSAAVCWRQQVRRGASAIGDHVPMFMPVQMLPEPMGAVARVPSSHKPPAFAQAIAEDRRIEISLPDGICIVSGAVATSGVD